MLGLLQPHAKQIQTLERIGFLENDKCSYDAQEQSSPISYTGLLSRTKLERIYHVYLPTILCV
jgi:hypothetical protein